VLKFWAVVLRAVVSAADISGHKTDIERTAISETADLSRHGVIVEQNIIRCFTR